MLDDVQLSKLLSHALRHEPEYYDLALNEDGWADLDAVIDAVRRVGDHLSTVSVDDVERVVRESPKQRFESDGLSIRAAYGHSVGGRIERDRVLDPPAVLYHASSRSAADLIDAQGLLPMGRQYVHLTTSPTTALRVGRRRDAQPVLYRIDARAFVAAGHVIYAAGPSILLADAVPSEFLERAEEVGE